MDKLTERLTKDFNGYNEYFAKRLDYMIASRAEELAPMYRRLQKSAIHELEVLNRDIEKLPEAKRKSKRVQIAMQKQYVTQILPDLELAKIAQDAYVTEVLCKTVEYGYYTTAYGLEQAAKVKVTAPILNRAGVLGLIANDWVGDGHTYSDRIRANTQRVATKSKAILKTLVTKRLSYDEAARQLSKNIKESYNHAVAIVRTEMTRANGLGASYAAMENSDILDGKYRDAVFDGKTSAMCARDADISRQKPYPLDYDTPVNPGIPGHRIPNHTNCRCRWCMVLSAIGVEERGKIARKNTDKDRYGDNYYTKASTFDGYAKERGLPTTAEMLKKDNPKRYLRPGETLEDFKKKFRRVKINGKTVTVAKAAWDTGTTIKQVAVDKAVEADKIDIKKLTADGKLEQVHLDEMESLLEASPGDIKTVWNKYADRLNIEEAHSKRGAAYCSYTKGITINIEDIAKGEKTISRVTGEFEQAKKPYYTLFHEFGHNISSLAAYDTTGDSFSDMADVFRSKKFTRTIVSADGTTKKVGYTLTRMLNEEGGAYFDSVFDRLKKEAKAKGLSARSVRKQDAWNVICQEIREKPILHCTDISDMWDGISKGDCRAHYGHGKSYWKRTSVGTEAFAEMFSATLMNPDSVREIQHYFPKSYELFLEILADIGV